jgi:hypothetical protein
MSPPCWLVGVLYPVLARPGWWNTSQAWAACGPLKEGLAAPFCVSGRWKFCAPLPHLLPFILVSLLLLPPLLITRC